MNVIIWNNKPAHCDTRMVTAVWFDAKKPTMVYYTIDGSPGVQTAKTKEIDCIITDAIYAKKNRLPAPEPAPVTLATDRVIARLERHQLDAAGEPVYGLYLNGRVIGCMTLATARSIYGDHLDVMKPGAPTNDAAIGSQDIAPAREVVNLDDDQGDDFESDLKGAAHLHENDTD